MESPHQPPESKNPGLIGLGLLLVLGLGLGLAHWFHPSAPEADRLPTPSVSSVFSTPAKLVVYQEGPAIPQLWLDTFSSGPGFPKIDLRILSMAYGWRCLSPQSPVLPGGWKIGSLGRFDRASAHRWNQSGISGAVFRPVGNPQPAVADQPLVFYEKSRPRNVPQGGFCRSCPLGQRAPKFFPQRA
ncbi:MAG: hypothetical protein EBT75_01010 [Proteobacteria bacterium]|nr:hypothetical protein [Pseudomonadota bacterium]